MRVVSLIVAVKVASLLFLVGEVRAMESDKERVSVVATRVGDQDQQPRLTIVGNIAVPQWLYKILVYQDWEKSQGDDRVSTPSSDDPFIHFSTDKQIAGVLQDKFSDCSYVVLRINPTRLVGELRLDYNKKGTEQYYHLYKGYIPMTAVDRIERYLKMAANHK